MSARPVAFEKKRTKKVQGTTLPKYSSGGVRRDDETITVDFAAM